MKHIVACSILVFTITHVSCSDLVAKDDFPVLKGPYLGQKPPGMKAEIFAPGIISTTYTEFANTFSIDGKEFYFTRYGNNQKLATTMMIKEVNGKWINPKIAPFSGRFDEVDPMFSIDGMEIFFSSRRPLKGSLKPKNDYDLWVVKRTKTGWSEPSNLGAPLNSDQNEFYPSLTKSGNLYFVSDRKGGFGKMDFWRSELINGKYSEPQNLGKFINTIHREGDGFIAPDESYFLFSAFIPGNHGSGDFYISFKKPNGTWTKAKNLGAMLNTKGNEFTPWVSWDNKYLFFASDRSGNDEIYWVDAKVIYDMKPVKYGLDNKPQPGAKKLYETIFKKGISAAKEQFAKIKNDKKFTFDEKEFLELGTKLRSFGYVAKSVQFFNLAIKLFPRSSGLWQHLGYAHVRLLNKEKAAVCYKKALEIDPKNWRAKEQLQLIDRQLDEARHETRAKMKYLPGTNTGLKGSYFGQKPPGRIPELFASGIVSVYGSNENTVTLTPDGKEIYFGKEAGVWFCKLTDEGWTAPENTGFQGYEMWVSPTTNKMYYPGYDPGIWVMDRKGEEWGTPVRLVKNGMFSTLTEDETLYTTVFKKGAFIGRYTKKGGVYSEPQILGPEVNTPNSFDAHPNVAPDGSYIIFDSDRPEGKGLYITFRKDDNTWTKARYLGKELSGICSTFSPDRKYLFFLKNRDIYWVDAKIIEKLKPEELK